MPFAPTGRDGWVEAFHLFESLQLEPGSHVFAALAEWEYPLSREAIATLDLLDFYRAAHHDKKKHGSFEPGPRPWPDPRKKKFGGTHRSQAEVLAALRARGHGVAPSAPPGRPRDARGRFVKKGADVG